MNPRQLFGRKSIFLRPDYQFMEYPENRSWCICLSLAPVNIVNQGLGFFNILDKECPVWFETSPNTVRALSTRRQSPFSV